MDIYAVHDSAFHSRIQLRFILFPVALYTLMSVDGYIFNFSLTGLDLIEISIKRAS